MWCDGEEEEEEEEEKIINSRGKKERSCDKVTDSMRCTFYILGINDHPTCIIVNSQIRRVRVSTLQPLWD